MSIKKTYFATVLLSTLLSATMAMSAEAKKVPVTTSQSEYQLKAEADKLLKILNENNKNNIVCIEPGGGNSIIFKAGINTEDNSGLVVQGDYSYGTDKIWQLNIGDSLFITWGEEANYTVVIHNLDGTDGLQISKTSGYLLLNDEKDDILFPIECSLEK